MKKKVLKEPTLVLMAGLPGVGKTTLARRLGELAGWVVLERDNFKEWLLEEKADEDRAGKAAYNRFFYMAEDILLDQGLCVILDTSTLYPFILERATDLAVRSRARLKIILCYVEEPTRQDRLRNRKVRISQSHADRIKEEDFKQFDNLPAGTLRVYTKGSVEEYAKKARKYVVEQEPQEPVECQGTSATSNSSSKHAFPMYDHFKHLFGTITRFSIQGY